MSDDHIRDLFRELREDTVPADSLARVRLKLSDGIRRRTRWKMAAWTAACAAVSLAMLLAALFVDAGRQPASAGRVARSRPVAAQELPLFTKHPVLRPAIRRTRRKARPVTNQSVSIRIETADPDVVILLVGE
jgi:hypothetical protein